MCPCKCTKKLPPLLFCNQLQSIAENKRKNRLACDGVARRLMIYAQKYQYKLVYCSKNGNCD